jgi:hypothetical protein
MQNYMGNFADVFHLMVNTPGVVRRWIRGFVWALTGVLRILTHLLSFSVVFSFCLFSPPSPSSPQYLGTHPVCELSSFARKSLKDYIRIHAREEG